MLASSPSSMETRHPSPDVAHVFIYRMITRLKWGPGYRTKQASEAQLAKPYIVQDPRVQSIAGLDACLWNLRRCDADVDAQRDLDGFVRCSSITDDAKAPWPQAFRARKPREVMKSRNADDTETFTLDQTTASHLAFAAEHLHGKQAWDVWLAVVPGAVPHARRCMF